jgi:hypothetical protein
LFIDEDLDSPEAIKLEIRKMEKSITYAERMEQDQRRHFAELYQNITCSHTEYTLEGPRIAGHSVEAQALDIADAKDAYISRIGSLKRRYEQWQQYKNQLDVFDTNLLNQFMLGNESSVVLRRVHLLLERYRSSQDTDGTKRAHQQFREIQKKNR